VEPADWQPAGIDQLEPNAWDALTHKGSACVVAGPGAGKTEFLAQRADYLLSTELCPRPRRILAISYKRDAARNLAERVAARTPDSIRRFDSLTFDAFTKGLVDRFRAALPELWRIGGDYEVWAPIPRNEIHAHFNNLQAAYPEQRGEIAELPRNSFVTDIVGAYELPSVPPDAPTTRELASLAWWDRHFKNADPPQADFVMLNRLAELIVRANPPIRRALLLTYPYVFVDEFQDTTRAQYALLRSVFGTGQTVLTAVGDDKQRIMGWAGALDDAFPAFQSNFEAKRFELNWNFRSSPALARLQHVVAGGIGIDAGPAVSKTAVTVDGNPIAIWEFDSAPAEARHIAKWIREDADSSGRPPDRYALIARQKVDDLQPLLEAELGRVGIPLRNDSETIGPLTLQDLLADDLAMRILDFLRLAATRKGNSDAWIRVSDLIARMHGRSGEDETVPRSYRELEAFIAGRRRWMLHNPPDTSAISQAVDAIVDYLDTPAIQSAFPAQRQYAYLEETVDAVKTRLDQVNGSGESWEDLCDRAEGRGAVPLMTIHKSKGLEYHTVIFLGLEDKQWWSYKDNPQEATRAFFVGLSRAEQRTIFTYCATRGSRQEIKLFYDLLDKADAENVQP